MPDYPIFPFGLIQVAGVHDLAEARMLVDHGVHLIGLPLRLPVNETDLSESQAAHLARQFPGRCCLITYLDKSSEIIDFTRYLGVDFVQLHGDLDPAIMPGLREKLPRVCFIKSLVIGRIDKAGLQDRLRAFAPHVWAFITDTYDPASGAEGATGLTHDWEVSRWIVGASPRPVILAGGLTPGNVANGIRTVQPAGVDVHTGIEDGTGRKDPGKVSAFVERSKCAFQANEGTADILSGQTQLPH